MVGDFSPESRNCGVMSEQFPLFPPQELRHWLGNMDVYFFDQLLKGRITPEMKVLDAGCGGGRNLVYLLRCKSEVYGFDANPSAVEVVRQLARDLVPGYPVDRFREGYFGPLEGCNGSNCFVLGIEFVSIPCSDSEATSR